MSTVLELKTEVLKGEGRFLLNGVSWKTYSALVEDPGLFGVRMTYDRGALELMSPSETHEYFAYLLGRFVEAATEELGISIRGCRSSTIRRELEKRGLEADESYYVQNEPAVRGRRGLDFEVDPPPDLAIEVEITKSILDKIEVYRSLGVSEVWRFDGKRLVALVLDEKGDYAEQQSSAALPQLALTSLVEWIDRSSARDDEGKPLDENSLIREFRQWVRDTLTGERGA